MSTALLIVGDTHCNSRLGLCPPAFNLKDGGTYKPNKTQRWLWDCWIELSEVFATISAECERNGILFMGDMVDADIKSRSHQIITRNTSEIVDIAAQCIEPMLVHADWAVFLKGTPSHVGKSAEIEEELASDCTLAQKNGENNYAWDLFYGMVGKVIVEAKHHGKLGYRRWTKTNPLHVLAEELPAEYIARREKPPQLAFRAHKHQHRDTWDNHPITRAVSTFAFCGTGEYGYTVSDELPDIGGLILIADGGQYELKKKPFPIPQRKLWKISV